MFVKGDCASEATIVKTFSEENDVINKSPVSLREPFRLLAP